ncbi:MAG: DUF4339 domain-containing protein [Actinomycetota bacterium]|nr:DUF4339 domain-containing protein [Actinomycetota bacterium]
MSDGWYVSRGGKVLGPYTWEGVLEYARVGMIAVEDMVMRPGSEEWVRADAVPAFFAGDAPTAPASAPTAAVLPAPSVPSAAAAAPGLPRVVPPVSPKRGSLTLVSVLAAVFILGVAVFILVPFMLGGTGTYSSASVSNGGPAAWWGDRIDGMIASVTGGGGGPGDAVTDMRGTWVSTTAGEGIVCDAVGGAGAVESGQAMRLESDVEMVIDGVEDGRATGKWRMMNTRVLLGGQSTPLPDSAFQDIVLDIGEDGSLSNASSTSSPMRMQGTVEGDRIQATFELTTSTAVVLTLNGTMDLTRSQ